MYPKHYTRQTIRILVLFLLLYHSGHTVAADRDYKPLTEATDLAADAAIARKQQKIILLLISQQNCPYCTLIKKEVLLPMNSSGEYDDRLIIRELFIDLGTRVRSFQGTMEQSRDFAYGYEVDLTPTLLFLGPDGEELSSRRIGVGNLEYYHYLVDRGIDEALQKLKQPL
jgi:thioredoxin-related protein